MKPGKFVADALLVLASLLVAFGMAELFLRYFPEYQLEEAALRLHWRATNEQEDRGNFIIQDPALGFRYRPNITDGVIARQDLRFTFNTDAEGFRNSAPRPQRADIVVLGDSMAFGYGVDDEVAWPRLLEKRLSGPSVVNLGLIGAAPQQYAMILERYGMPLEPRLTLATLFPGNDLTDAQAFDDWQQHGDGMPYAEWQLVGHNRAWWRRLLEEARGRSHVIAFGMAAAKRLGSLDGGTTINLDDGGTVQLAPAARRFNAELSARRGTAFQLAVEALERIRTLASQSGGEFAVLLMPTKEDVYLPSAEGPERSAITPFLDVLNERGMRYLDLTDDFRAEAGNGKTLFHRIDGHPNELGYRLTAEAVRAFVEDFYSDVLLNPEKAERPMADCCVKG